MAKAANTREIEISERAERTFVKDILQRFENIESARGSFMNKARREREAMAEIYEGLAARGFSQKIAKLHIETIRLEEKLKGKYAEMDSEERKIALKLAKARGDKKQLLMFGELPPAAKPPKPEKDDDDGKQGDIEGAIAAKKKGSGASGDDLAQADAQGSA